MITITIQDETHLSEAAKQLLNAIGDSKIFALYGTMGAGKTTFVKALCKELGATDCVTSPTFTIVNEYIAGNGSSIFHFDFYRLKQKSEAFDFGFEEYIDSNGYLFMEWPEIVEDLLPDNTVKVYLTVDSSDNSRTIKVL